MADTRMTRSERETFLADVHIGILAIGREDAGAAPLAAPIWYGYRPAGEIEVITGRNSRKGTLLEAGRAVTLVAQTETPPYRYVSVEGSVSAIRPADVERDLRPMARRYLGVRGGDQYADASSGEDSVLVSITPGRWLTVDYGKITG